jgi:hypothetical protein
MHFKVAGQRRLGASGFSNAVHSKALTTFPDNTSLQTCLALSSFAGCPHLLGHA